MGVQSSPSPAHRAGSEPGPGCCPFMDLVERHRLAGVLETAVDPLVPHHPARHCAASQVVEQDPSPAVTDRGHPRRRASGRRGHGPDGRPARERTTLDGDHVHARQGDHVYAGQGGAGEDGPIRHPTPEVSASARPRDTPPAEPLTHAHA